MPLAPKSTGKIIPAPVVIALDGMDASQALALAKGLTGLVWGFKVNDLLLDQGAQIITQLKAYGRVFADPKLHDIPNTVANQVRVLEQAGADLITLHCAGGRAMLSAGLNVRAGSAKLLGVTVLTSTNEAAAQELFGRGLADTVEHFARLGLDADLDGLVCSPQELTLMDRLDPGRTKLRVTPGVRPAWHTTPDDQSRTASPAQALAGGASLLVVGRPVTQAADPAEACRKLMEECGLPTI
ncbi:MAG: orotidine-5'-phosphate decarboxylase [Deltaproteobacteria bacterium]|nr:orotidine-5'-phosphate decarboxylase [Deltaproteobacteria bacterium]